MLSEFTKIVDRNFVIGYLLPIVLFISANVLLVQLFFPQFNLYTNIFISQSQNNSTISTASDIALIYLIQNFLSVSLAALTAIILSIILMILNRILIRIVEGYYLFRHTPLQQRQLNKFRTLSGNLNRIEREREEERKRTGTISPESEKKYEAQYMETLLKLKERFPPSEEHILPTSFGNVIRAFELYPQVLYGMDSIPIWVRISSLLSKESTQGLNDSKAQVDFAINSMYLALMIFLEYIAFAAINRSLLMIWIPILALGITIIWYQFAISTASEWGYQVKAIFDLYRNTLLSQMGVRIPNKWEDERIVWQKISRSFLYLDQLDIERDAENIEGKPESVDQG